MVKAPAAQNLPKRTRMVKAMPCKEKGNSLLEYLDAKVHYYVFLVLGNLLEDSSRDAASAR